MSVLFKVEPSQWGLRGDPYLWKEMKSALGFLPLVESEAQLILLVEKTFDQLTGLPLNTNDDIFIERYSHGGMSSGYVCTDFWRKKVVPLLLTRLLKILQQKTYKILNDRGVEIEVNTPGKIGGHRRLKIYGRLDCPSALAHIKKGNYVKHRVYFADEESAIAAGYRPCAKCMKPQYEKWKLELGK
jgi:hypothetical protein